MLYVASVFTLCCFLLRVFGSLCAKFETGHTFYLRARVRLHVGLLKVISTVKKRFHGFLRNLTLNQGTLKRFETFDEARGIWENVRMLWKSPRYAPVMKSSTFGLGLRVHDGGTFSTHETDCRGLMSLHGFHKRIIFVREC